MAERERREVEVQRIQASDVGTIQAADLATAASPAQQASRAFAEGAAEAEKLQLDETGPNPHYLTADGRKVKPDGSEWKPSKSDDA